MKYTYGTNILSVDNNNFCTLQNLDFFLFSLKFEFYSKISERRYGCVNTADQATKQYTDAIHVFEFEEVSLTLYVTLNDHHFV